MRANICQRADVALWLAGKADLPAVGDHAVRKVDPFPLGQQPHQVLFDLDRVGVPGETQPLAQACDMSIDDHAGRNAKGGAQDDVGGLATHARQLDQRGQVLGHLAAMFSDQAAGGAGDALGLVAKEPGALDGPLEVGRAGGRQGLGVGVFGKQVRRDHVHPNVGALGREDGRHQQFQRRTKHQRTVGVGIGRLEPPDDTGGVAFCVGSRNHAEPGRRGRR